MVAMPVDLSSRIASLIRFPYYAMTNEHESVITATRDWLEKAVIGLNLCPFAKAVYVKQQVRLVVSDARNLDALLEDLDRELDRLAEADPEELDTTLLIHPYILNDFLDYNEFLDVADGVVAEHELEGVIQIASFHPQYQFADTEPDDISNYSNRSPYPTLHLLREDSIDRAVAAFPDAADIFEKNIATLRELGQTGWDALGMTKASK
ncbi:hypothetical protein GCM10007907_35540 [Chitinimonas prasina]|uniref:DUF1415 domain-containing protein n=2 Tax=Chitinimonas prasina TaxID=1434937 RepID=A0ABQ5YLD3_9NEIS|nr:hypothetical protein GCM10007907_35540 [Chitinimonas prasina]